LIKNNDWYLNIAIELLYSAIQHENTISNQTSLLLAVVDSCSY